jgi:hypothetical protein
MDRIMLIDAHSLIYRAYFALLETPLTTSKGQLVNAAFGFWSIVLRGFQDVKPDYVIACFDVGRTFRHDRFTEYKATRRPTPDDLRDQFPIALRIANAPDAPDETRRNGFDHRLMPCNRFENCTVQDGHFLVREAGKSLPVVIEHLFAAPALVNRRAALG